MEIKLKRLKDSMDHTVLRELQFTEKNKMNVRKRLELEQHPITKIKNRKIKKPQTGMAILSSAACLMLLAGGLGFGLYENFNSANSNRGTASVSHPSHNSTDKGQIVDQTTKSASNLSNTQSPAAQIVSAPVKAVALASKGNQVWFVTSNAAYASTDAGQTFHSVQSVQTGEFIGAFHTLDSQNAALLNIVTQDGSTRVLKSGNFGQTWTTQTQAINGEGTYSFISKDVGWYLTDGKMDSKGDHHFKLYQTIDGGNHWREISKSTSVNQTMMKSGLAAIHLKGNLEGLTFINQNHGFLYNKTFNEDNSIYMYETQDGGSTWTPVNLNRPVQIRMMTKESLDSIHMVNQKEGYFVLRARNADATQTGFVVYTTNDGGKSWKPSQPVVSKHTLEVSSSVTSDQIFVTNGETMYRFNHVGQLLTKKPLTFDGHHITNLGPVTLTMSNDQTGLIHVEAAHVALLYKTSDGGTTWKSVPVK